MKASTLIVAIAFVGAPGAGLTFLLLPPRRAPLPVRLAAIVPFGYVAIGAISLALILLHVLTAAAFFAVYGVATAATWWFGLRRYPIRDHVSAWRQEVVGERWPYLLGLALIAGAALVRLTYSGIYNLFDQTPLRYWADGLEIADAHRIPADSLQWGHLFPSTVSKAFLNAFDAAASLALGRGPVAPMGALLFVVSVGVIVGAFALFRELGLRWTAPLLVVLLFANRVRLSKELTTDLMRYKAENVGRMLMLVALVFVVRALRTPTEERALRTPAGERGTVRREALIGGALFGALAATHLVPFVVGVAFAAGYALARIVLSRSLMPVLRASGLVAAAAVVLGGIALFAPRGDVGFQGASNTAAYQALARQLGQPACWDPTLYLSQNKIDQPCHTSWHGFYDSPSYIYREFSRRTLGQTHATHRYMILLPIGYAVALGLLLWRGDDRLRSVAIAAAALAVLLLLATLYFSFRYNVYAIAQFGERRLFDYAGVPMLMLAAGVLEVALLELARVRIGGSARGWLAPAAAALVFVVAAAALLPKDRLNAGSERFLTTALGPLSLIERNVPCDGRILADRRTLATFQVYTRHAGVLEGMGPYLRPDVLSTAIREMLAARQFFLDPAAHESYLRDNGIWGVVVTAPSDPLGGALKVAQLNRTGLDSAPFLQVVTQSPALTVYRYTGYDPAAAARFPSVVGRPGFECGAR